MTKGPADAVREYGADLDAYGYAEVAVQVWEQFGDPARMTEAEADLAYAEAMGQWWAWKRSHARDGKVTR